MRIITDYEVCNISAGYGSTSAIISGCFGAILGGYKAAHLGLDGLISSLEFGAWGGVLVSLTFIGAGAAGGGVIGNCVGEFIHHYVYQPIYKNFKAGT